MEDLTFVNLAVAFAGGFVSFVSPCVLALVPGYLSFISGVSFDELGSRTRDVVVPTIAFVAGFAALFTAYGAGAGLVGYSLRRQQDTLNLVAGTALIVIGVAMIALPRLGLLQVDRRLQTARRPTTLVGAALVGAAFAVGWTPCIGPILASILNVALPTGSPTVGALLLFTYALGLGIPFLLAGLYTTRALGLFRWLRDRWTVVNAVSASLVVLVGILIATGRFEVITRELAGIGFQGI